MLTDKNVTLRSRLGFIGLGYLGSRIARRLAAAGFPMVVYDRDREKTKQIAADLGAAVASSSEELCATHVVVVSCLPNDAAVEAVYLGTGGLLENIRPGTLIIEQSTVAPETSRQV